MSNRYQNQNHNQPSSSPASTSSTGGKGLALAPNSSHSHPSLLMPPPATLPPSHRTTTTMKQRRVSLPGTSSLLHADRNASAELVALGGGRMGGGGAAEDQVIMNGNGWGVSFRDDLGLPTSNSTANGSSSSSSSVHVSAHTRSSSQGGGGGGDPPPLTDQISAPTSSMVTRRRRATTTTANIAPSKGKVREFVVPADPVPVPAPAPTPSPVATPSIDDATAGSGGPPSKPRKPRKRWTMEETQHLVDGCNKWGVGNWKAILNDTQFQFQGRSPVDLKDRFRTYFPDAYRTHYPNAKTHLSTRIRSFLPDGTPIFAKTRSKKRRPFSAEEDAALRRGYEKYGTTWATIVKDPVFKSMERRSTDLRDRFRNAFPDLYKAAGYKPRPRAGTTSSATSATTPVEGSSSKTKETKRGRKAKGAAAAPSTAGPSRSASNSQSRVASSSSRRKRTSAATTLSPGEPTAADFYRPRAKNHRYCDEDELDFSRAPPSESEEDGTGYNSSEDEDPDPDEDERFYPLSAVSTVSTTSADRMLALAQAWTRELSGTTMTDGGDDELDEDLDMDVDGDVMLSQSPPDDDGGIDGTELRCARPLYSDGGPVVSIGARRASTSGDPNSGPSSLSPPSVTQSIQDLLLNKSLEASGDGSAFSGGMAFATHNQQTQPPFVQSLSASTSVSASTSTSVQSSEDWSSIGRRGEYTPHGGPIAANGGTSSSSHWMSSPTSPTTSEFYHHSGLDQGGGPSLATAAASGGPSNSRIGKSAWVPQDWLSNNPRLDQNLGILAGNGALTSWPTPAPDPHAVLDRYDLYSAVEAAHEFASEAAYGHHHNHHNHASHTHTYPDDSVFREFTHHRYAGDLIPGSGVAVHPPHLGQGEGGSWSFSSLGLSLAALSGLDTASLHDDYASSVTSGSNIGLAGLRGPGLHDLDEVSLSNYGSGSTAPSGAASPMKLPTNPPSVILGGQQQQLEPRSLDLDAMILVDSDEASTSAIGLALGQSSQGGMDQLTRSQSQSSMELHLGIPSPTNQVMEEAGAVTPTSFPASLPCPPSPLRVDQPRLPTVDFSQHRKQLPPPHRPHSRSMTQGHPPQTFRPSTPLASRDASRSFSQPPSEHRLALQRSLSYLDPITSNHAASAGLFGPFVEEDPLAYNEPLSISSLDLQYGMSAGPNIFTPLTMFSEPQTIAPARTINSGFSRSNAFGNRPTPTPPPSNSIPEEALDISSLIHTSPIPAPRNHQRHQSQSVTTHTEPITRKTEATKKRSSWDGFQLDLFGQSQSHDEASFFMEFSRSSQ